MRVWGNYSNFQGGVVSVTEGVIYKPGNQYAGKHRIYASNGITNLNLLKPIVQMPQILR